MAAIPISLGQPTQGDKVFIAKTPPSAGGGGLLSSLAGAAGMGGGTAGAGAGMADQALGLNTPGSGGQQLTAKINPSSQSWSFSANWQRHPSPGGIGQLQYGGANPTSLSIELMLDASDAPDGDVQKDIDFLRDCCTPTPESVAAGTPCAPFVLFGWGG